MKVYPTNVVWAANARVGKSKFYTVLPTGRLSDNGRDLAYLINAAREEFREQIKGASITPMAKRLYRDKMNTLTLNKLPDLEEVTGDLVILFLTEGLIPDGMGLVDFYDTDTDWNVIGTPQGIVHIPSLRLRPQTCLLYTSPSPRD